MSDSAEKTTKVSDPTSKDYDPNSPFYDVTADSSSEYYVGPLADKAASGDEIRAGATAGTDLLFNLLGWGDTALNGFKDMFTQRMYEKQLENARQGLEKDLEIRNPGQPPSTVWANATHEQMQAAIVDNADSAAVGETSEEWVRIGNELATHQRNLAKAINASTANWQGEGGDAAREHLAGVGKWLGATANGATLTGRQQQIHSQTLNETQKQMAANPPVPFDVREANANLQTITDPYQYMSQLGKDLETFKKQQDARDRAAQVMTQFDTTVGSAIATPAFPSPPKLPSAQATRQLRGTPAGGGAGSPAHALRDPNSPENADGTQRPSPFDVGSNGAGPDGIAASTDGTAHGGGAGGPGGVSPFNSPNGPSGGTPGGGFPGGGGPGSHPNPPGISVPDLPTGGDGYRPAAASGPTMPNLPKFDDGTHTTGYTPPSIQPPSYQPPNVQMPTIPEGGGPRTGPGGGLPYTPPNIPIPNRPTGGPGPVMPKIPPIGNPGGSGDNIGRRLGGLPSIPDGGSYKGTPYTPPKLPNLPNIPGGGGGGNLGGIGAGGTGAGGGGLAGAGRSTGSLGMGGAVGAGAMDAEAAAARAAGSGKAGTPGAMGPMGGMAPGGAKGKGEDDKEHKVADYVESDDPSFFAPDEVVAPPVIGDWKNKDWK
ncbi:hypothetical protein [Amycolatopsis regifaucium]|uniref:PPE family domain-containing protein n=1 Tax=Amycolatopsis regifaucium TaxID=546365 RepID=A0A154MAW8_9PSEU|nr:hypothetical protein [Amycolatopsis regifaucium]KZB81702.1 hypothetical protein AVL48_06890 [Amycolatopsis regifaucium]OKA06232.1 hypothetical protein ATP06_0224130 [Amycolatopsis regifaucium]SFG68543.1 hypothetical protein SAMN04489731_101143 [Amycolatopsis regifaucium]